MVKMGIYVIELFPGFTHFEQRPCRCASAGCIPSERRHVRGFWQPECAPFFKFYFLGVVENHHYLAGGLAVVPADSDSVIIRALFLYVFCLKIKGFLHAHNIGCEGFHHLCWCCFPVFPGVFSVFGDAHSDVEWHYVQFFLSGFALCKCHQYWYEKQKFQWYSFHIHYVFIMRI